MNKSWGCRESHEGKPATCWRGWGRGDSGLEATGEGIGGIYQRWPEPWLLELPGRRRQEEVTGTEPSDLKCKLKRLRLGVDLPWIGVSGIFKAGM